MAKARLLVVEDDVDISNMLRIFFTGQGYDVDVALRGTEQAVRAQQQHDEQQAEDDPRSASHGLNHRATGSIENRIYIGVRVRFKLLLNGFEASCPWHSAKFNIATGECLQGPVACRVDGSVGVGEVVEVEKVSSLTCYDVKLDGEQILVKVRQR